jgi:Arc/MetJ-type ribon-helix-helix transcriptional regulator
MADTEKITINMSAVDLGKIDLLVQEGVYSNRTDFIRTAIRSQLEKHTMEVQQSISRNSYGIGVFVYERSDLEIYKAKGEKVKFNVVGLLHLGKDISASLANEVIESIQVRGIFQAPDEVKSILSDRIK